MGCKGRTKTCHFILDDKAQIDKILTGFSGEAARAPKNYKMDKLSTLPDEKYLCKYQEFLNTFNCNQPEKNIETNRLIDISIPMKNQQPLKSMKKRKPQPKEKRENRTTIQNQEAG
jgi:hypothetical protein